MTQSIKPQQHLLEHGQIHPTQPSTPREVAGHGLNQILTDVEVKKVGQGY
jgi:hypothetical protein